MSGAQSKFIAKLKQRNATLEADRDQWKETATNHATDAASLRDDRDRLKAALERSASLLEDYAETFRDLAEGNEWSDWAGYRDEAGTAAKAARSALAESES